MRIIVTGGSGYLGSAAVTVLRARGHEVATIGRHADAENAVCDLTDAETVRRAVRVVGNCDAVVHLAARAHDFQGLSLADLLLANTTTTRHLAAALAAEGRTPSVRFVYASSVAVYELLEGGRGLTAAQSPYSASKLQAEQLLHAEPFQSLCVLRFAPIYDRTHLQDVAKRVFLPGGRLKLRLCPPPVHALCALDTAVQAIVSAVESQPAAERRLANVADATPISQHELIDWFPGKAVSVPTSLLQALARGAGLCGAKGRKVSRLIGKFCGASRYPEPDWQSTLAWPGVTAGGANAGRVTG